MPGYRMESAKPAIMKFGYAVNYDQEIAQDEANIAYLSSEFAKRVATWVEGWAIKAEAAAPGDRWMAGQWAECTGLESVIVMAPEILRETLDLTNDDLRALWVYLSSEADPEKIEKNPFGPEQPGDYGRGSKLMAMQVFFPLGVKTWNDWRTIRETGKGGRCHALKNAKASLARHKRNKTKFGGK